MNIEIFSDEEYNTALEDVILPWVKEHLIEEDFNSFDGGRLHYYYALRDDARAAIVISHGFCEFVGKYYEMMYYFYMAGYSVFFLDHRGHGYSVREVDKKDLVHIHDFHTYVRDMECFIEGCVKQKSVCGRLFMYAHSMGGAIAALYLENNPGIIEKVVLSSPMIEMATAGAKSYEIALVKLLSHVPFLAKQFGPGQHGFDNIYKYKDSSALSEPRYAFIFSCRQKDEHFTTYGGSFAWTRESLNISKEIIKNAPKVQIPVILFQAGKDNLVEPQAQQEFCRLAKDARLVRYDDSKHEIYNATDDIRAGYIKEIITLYA